MQVIILAAGRGTRMKNLTNFTPKPMLLYEGKTLLKHKLENLPNKTKEILIVIGYRGEIIKKHLGNYFNNIPIKYVQQDELLGTGHAIFLCKDLIKNDFISLMGDDIYSKDGLDRISENSDWEMLVHQNCSGNIKFKDKKIVEITNKMIPNLPVWTGAVYLNRDIFNKKLIRANEKEFGLPQTFIQFKNERPIKISYTKKWKRITTPDDLG